jgi:hypothetical protein
MYEKDQESVKFLADETVKAKLANAKKLSEVSAKVNLVLFPLSQKLGTHKQTGL